jgi:F0F1-type ATP synthase delta subunit
MFGATAATYANVDLKKWKLPSAVGGHTANMVEVLFRTAVENNTLATVRAELKQVREETKEEDFMVMLKQEASLEKVLDVSLETRVLLEELAETNKLNDVIRIQEDFELTCREALNEVHVSVITHTAYPADAKKAVEKDLQDNYVDKGKSLVAEFSVDPQIIGGRIYCFEDNIMDMSVKQMIEQWHEEKQDTLRAINNEQVAELAAQFAQPETAPSNKKLIAAVQQRASVIEKQLGYTQ